jgi:antitoxin component of MazEF toxin-antitoxin module
MIDVEKQQRFIQLRAQGWSFARIAKELDTCKGMLITLSRKFQFEIQNQRAVELEALQEQLVATRESRARALAEQLQRVEQELQKRDFSEVSTGRLFGLAESLRRQILRETGSTKFVCSADKIPADEYHEQIHSWSP